MKILKALLCVLTLSAVIGTGVCAASNKDAGELCFGSVKYSETGGYVTVSANVDNNTAESKNAILLVASYNEKGRMYNLRINRQSVGAGSSCLLQIADYLPQEGCAVKAYVMENLFGNGKIPMPAKMGTASAELAYILVNNEPIKDFNNENTRYLVKNTDNLEIEVAAKDNTTAVAITKVPEINVYDITVTASGGESKTFTVAAYDKVEDTTAITKLTYKADNEEFEHTVDFKNTIELPENAKTVEIKAISDYSKSVSYYVVNNAVTSPVPEVSYGTMSAASRTAFTYERPMKDNILPIKNEESKAIIKVTGLSEAGREEEAVYDVVFKAKQPRLTSFESENRTYYPVFVGGAAIYDDNGSTCASDRNHIIKGMSEELIGGSAFLFPVNNKESDTWWGENSSGTYFTFTADTSGTVYVISQSTINNSEYTEDSNNKKWKKSDVFAYKFEYSDNEKRVNNPDSILIPPESGDKDPEQSYASAMKSSYCKKFRAGENVEIYHTGNNSSVNDPKVFAVVVWNDKTETITALEGISSQLDKETPFSEQIPGEITATTEENEKLLVEVNWDLDTYDKEKTGWQEVSGTVVVPKGYILKDGISDKVSARVIVLQDSDYLSGLSYKIDGKTFAVAGFDPKTLTYTVELPDYTNTVEVVTAGSGTVETYVENNCTEFSVGTVNYGKMTSAAQNVFTRQRPAKGNIIPIKNEESAAVIKVKNTLNGFDYGIEYKVVFKSRQIRLTSFSTVEAKTVLKPVFVGGAAVFDDGRYDSDAGVAAAGSVTASDRDQIVVEVPEQLKGASSFLFPVSNKEPGSESDPETNNWWYKHNEGAYFTFTAEQGGTIYIFAQNSFKNSEYTADSHNEGWEKSGYTIKLKNPEVTWSNAYSRSFKKGETVNVYHTGNGGSSSANAYKITGMVVWNEPIIKAIDSIAELNIDVTKEAKAQLPKTVKITIANGNQLDADVIWDLTDFDNSLGTHTVKGRITDEFIAENEFVFADGVKNEVTVTVNVTENGIKSLNSISPVDILQGESISEKLPETVTAKTIFDETVSCGVIWNTDGFDSTNVGITEITGTIVPPEGINAGGVTAKVKAIVRYSSANIVLALENGGMDTAENKWKDLSKYKNDITIPTNSVNIKWDEKGLYAKAGVEELLEIPLTNEIKDAIKSHKFAVEFELADIQKQNNGETPLLTADIEYTKDTSALQGKLIISYNDNKKRNDFKFGGNLTKYWAVSDINSILSPHINRVEVGDGVVYWIIDGERSEKSLNNVNITDVTRLTIMGNSKITNSNTIGGSAVWKSLKIYKVTD